jgi:signal transduction histidine kinase
MNIDSATSRLLSEFWIRVEPEMPEIIDEFCRYAASAAPPNAPIDDRTRSLKSTLAAHWERLFSGNFGNECIDGARAVGRLCADIGLEPGQYLGGYNVVRERLIAVALRKSSRSQTKVQAVTSAVGSVIAFDMDIAMSAFVISRIELERFRQQDAVADAAKQQIAKLLAGFSAAIYTGRLELGGGIARFEVMGGVERLSGLQASAFKSWQAWVQRAAAIDEFVWRAHFEKAISEGAATIEYDFRHEDGSLLRLRDQIRIIERLENGEAEIAGYISDITSDYLTSTQTATSAKLATLGKMASGLAHEINQPFTIMSLAAENSAKMLQERGPEGIGYTINRLHRIRDQAARARAIIDHMRIFGGLGTGAKAPVQLTEAVDGAFSLVGGALGAASIHVTNELDNSLPPVSAGKVMVEQVLVNLMLNAVDAMEKNPAGSLRRLVLRSSIDRGAGTVSLLISDTGPGIPDSIHDRLFDPFFTTKEVGKGIGLGLSICHGIMTSFGGSIAANNMPEGGAVFILTFQIA